MRILNDSGSARLWAVAAVAVVALVLLLAWLTRAQPVFSERCVVSVNGDTYTLEPDQTQNAALITAIGVRRGLPARASSIAIATAIQESKLRNIDFGDRDSIGLFQQRPSQGWGTREEIMDPIYATNAFYDVLVKIEGYESLPITDAAQKVQRSGYPRAYADHEPEARAFASALSGHSPAALTCRLKAVEAGSEQAAGSGLTPRAEQVVADLEEQIGNLSTAPGDSPNQVVVSVGTDRQAWQVAQWAVAGAAGHGITQVSTASHEWRRSDGAGADWVTAPGQPGAVVITVG